MKVYIVEPPSWTSDDSLMCGSVPVVATSPGQARMEWMAFWARLGWWKPQGADLRRFYLALKVRRSDLEVGATVNAEVVR
jgi:hypothetical protein